MKTMTIIMAICLLVLMAVPAITPVDGKGNSAFSDWEAGPCPSCYAWRCDEGEQPAVCFIGCQPYAQDAYYLWVELYKEDEYGGHYSYQHVLCVLSGLNRCICNPFPDLCCHEYTAKLYLDLSGGWELSGGFWLTDGENMDNQEDWICPSLLSSGPPEWAW